MITIPDFKASDKDTFLPDALGRLKAGALSPLESPFTPEALAITNF
jgi:hypothetical protein